MHHLRHERELRDPVPAERPGQCLRRLACCRGRSCPVTGEVGQVHIALLVHRFRTAPHPTTADAITPAAVGNNLIVIDSRRNTRFGLRRSVVLLPAGGIHPSRGPQAARSPPERAVRRRQNPLAPGDGNTRTSPRTPAELTPVDAVQPRGRRAPASRCSPLSDATGCQCRHPGAEATPERAVIRLASPAVDRTRRQQQHHPRHAESISSFPHSCATGLSDCHCENSTRSSPSGSGTSTSRNPPGAIAPTTSWP